LPFLGVNVAILEDGKILLTRREDFEVWCLPGGAVDEGESVAQAAIRETREETGLEVELTRLVGIYSSPHAAEGGRHVVLFAARPVGGEPAPQPGEVIEMRYCLPGEIPEALLVGQRQRIDDALDGAGGLAWRMEYTWPFPGLSRQEVYALRDRSGLSRQEFYQHYFRLGPAADQLEVGG
jgi:ADP-ribose pyrophosphatase YjhB (NUDIX family)